MGQRLERRPEGETRRGAEDHMELCMGVGESLGASYAPWRVGPNDGGISVVFFLPSLRHTRVELSGG